MRPFYLDVHGMDLVSIKIAISSRGKKMEQQVQFAITLVVCDDRAVLPPCRCPDPL